MRYFSFFLFLTLLMPSFRSAIAQRLVLSGQVVEAVSGEPVPFASVFVPGTSQGVTADVEGKFRLAVAGAADSLGASALGFATQRRKLSAEATQTVLFRLRAGGVALAEVVVSSRQPENPAFRILREVQRHKPENQRSTLRAAEFDSYNRTEVSLSELPARLARSKVVRDIRALAVRRGAAAAADPDAPLPLFASEVGSRVYQQFDPLRHREDQLHRQLRGVGPREGSVVAQLLGGGSQNFDFYPNWQNILSKDFTSPIAEGGRLTYDYELQDSVFVGKDWCYKIAVTPRRGHDLAFRGTVWITAGTYALRRLDLTANAEANINFITDLRIFQDLTPPAQGPGLPVRTRLVFGVKPYEGQAAMRVRQTTVNSNLVRNVDHAAGFYDVPVNVVAAADAPGNAAALAGGLPPGGAGGGYFDQHRPDTLSLSEQQTFAVLDSAQQLPSVRSLLDWAELLVNGYAHVGNVEWGPLLHTYAYNDLEGHRFRVGFRTAPSFHPSWTTQVYAAYGTRDERLKYGLKTSYLLERRHWTVVGAEYRHDVEQLALLDNDFLPDNNLFVAATRSGPFRSGRPVLRDLATLSVQRDLFHGFTQTLLLRRQQLRPLHDFAYYPNNDVDDTAPAGRLGRDLTLTEVVLEARYARDENLVQGENRRRAIGLKRWPVAVVRYTLGARRVLGSDFDYQKFNLLLTHSLPLGQLGRTNYRLEGSYIPSRVPYPLLKTPLGNPTPFLNPSSFNLMRPFEFVLDRSVSLRVEHHFEGLLLNAIPGIWGLNWRLVAAGSLLYGDLSAANRRLLPPTDGDGRPLPRLRSLGSQPYAEVSYGIENIFKLVRLDFIHRLTYRDLPDSRNFGIRAGLQFRL